MIHKVFMEYKTELLVTQVTLVVSIQMMIAPENCYR